jgi:hypothetical protein
MYSVPLSISSAGLTPAGLPGAKAPSAAKADEPTNVATVTAATTLLKPNIAIPRLSMAGILVRSRKPSQPAIPNSFLTVAKRLYRIGGHNFRHGFALHECLHESLLGKLQGVDSDQNHYLPQHLLCCICEISRISGASRHWEFDPFAVCL